MRHKARALPLVLGVLLLAACNGSNLPVAPSPTPTQGSLATPTTDVSQLPPTSTVAPTDLPTLVPATNTPAEIGTDTPEAVSPTAEANNTAEATQVSTPEATTVASTPNPALEAEIKDIEQKAVTVRGLKPKSDVPETFLTSSQMQTNLANDTRKEYTPEEAKRDANELWLQRLLPDRNIDLLQMEINLLGEQVLGYYDPKAKKLFVLNNGSNLTPLSRVTLEHEYTHALQDQNYDLQKLLPDQTNDGDKALAIRSLVEGDATMSELTYAQRYFTPEEIQKFIEESSNAPSGSLNSVPAYIRESLEFPYNEGVTFVKELVDRGGFAAVNKALVDPPKSTEQIMHPEKYSGAKRDDPIPVPLQPLTDTLGAGWTMKDSGTTGEFDVKIMLQENGASDPETGADGWGGGSYAFYQNGDKVLLLIKYDWDNQVESNEFMDALKETFAKDELSGSYYVDAGRYFSVHLAGKVVTIVSSNDESALQKVANTR